ncbi:PREDICTED: inactive peptidyl-prolyl cis-trans isomerase FKBP6-like [Myotis brandtii]|uniref:inactive peptidyl-prolyl cis-trans isomerase FKBP6-like n=1 Tax=Myotis brandtii TaxID=109478 RepID=UPI000703C392|nr:PREDICTED: inactive peptidyl-prolyl cis-trans isomerase FKBP6-like [Myotis brandtii]
MSCLEGGKKKPLKQLRKQAKEMGEAGKRDFEDVIMVINLNYAGDFPARKKEMIPDRCRRERRRDVTEVRVLVHFSVSVPSVLVKYSGYLEHMDKPFDSNCFRKTPRLMKLGVDITLWGMELGLLTMRRGELARFLFKPPYAYGTLGCPPLIPPNSTVLFEIELIDFLDSAESDKFCALTAEQQDQFPLQKVLKVAATEREFGNYLFRQNRFYDAKVRYKRIAGKGDKVFGGSLVFCVCY